MATSGTDADRAIVPSRKRWVDSNSLLIFVTNNTIRSSFAKSKGMVCYDDILLLMEVKV